jgi:methyltransferase (TIGR00027 family)
MDDPVSIRHISETAHWTAVYRARETDAQCPLFRDRYARRLAGCRGEEIAKFLPYGNRHSWAWVIRTYLFDEFIMEQTRQGTDMIINLAAGLDARPYRMDLPATLTWVEIDLPDILAYKEDILRGENAACVIERISLDLADRKSRRKLFTALGARSSRALIVTEGFVIYLTAEQVGFLATDLAALESFRVWVLDIVSPGLLRMLRRNIGAQLSRSGCSLQFGPSEGPGFFSSNGWKPVEVRSLMKTAVLKKRSPFAVRLLALLPESSGRQGTLPWSGVALLENTRSNREIA